MATADESPVADVATVDNRGVDATRNGYPQTSAGLHQFLADGRFTDSVARVAAMFIDQPHLKQTQVARRLRGRTGTGTVSPKREERVAPPASDSLWELRFATSDAAQGWDELRWQAAANTLVAYEEMRRREVEQEPTTRHHRLKGTLATGVHNGIGMEQWQYEVPAGGRVWYLTEPDMAWYLLPE